MNETPRGHTGGAGTTHSPSPRREFIFGDDDTTKRLTEEVIFLQRKIKYMHSVSTIFRQKIALIMREMSKNPSSSAFQEHQRLYTLALSELTKAEAESDVLPRADSELAMPPSLRAGSAGTADKTQRSREDIAKAHQLCLILQEKNDLKQAEIQLRADLATQREAYAELYERHQRLVELQATGTGSQATRAQAELFREREEALQRRLDQAHDEIAQLRAASSRAAGTTAGEGNDGALLKQNNLLKTRIAKLKEELQTSMEHNAQSAQQLQHDIQRLSEQLQLARNEMEARDRIVKVVRSEKSELAKELIALRSNVEYLQSKLATAASQGHTTARDGSSVTALVAAAAASQESSSDELQELRTTVQRLTNRCTHLEESCAETSERLMQERTLNAQKDSQISALGAQLKAFRSRVDAFEADQSQRDMQQALLSGVETRMLEAVQDMRKAQSAESLSKQVATIQTQLGRLEGLEMQLRQKEDTIALMEDECCELRQQHEQLRQSLLAVSSLFMQLPRSVESLERTVIELEEYKNEVRRCADERVLPELLRVEGNIELRCLEAETQRRQRRTAPADDVDILGDDFLGLRQQASIDGATDVDFATSDAIIPPLPALMDITDRGWQSTDEAMPNVDDLIKNDSPSRTTEILEEDARLTFQLFDERGSGFLPMDAVRLCLTTLGLPASLAPTNVLSMSAAEFLAMCVQRKP